MFDRSRVDRPAPVAGVVLESTDPTSLSDADLIACTKAAERQASHARSVALQAVAVLADRAEGAADRSHETACAARARKRGLDAPEPEELAARAAIDQVRQTLRLSATTATNRIDLARTLTRGPLTALGAALGRGEVTLAHARVALTHTEGRDPDLVRDMLARTLPRRSRRRATSASRWHEPSMRWTRLRLWTATASPRCRGPSTTSRPMPTARPALRTTTASWRRTRPPASVRCPPVRRSRDRRHR